MPATDVPPGATTTAPATTAPIERESAFRSYDGADLFYRAWLPPAGTASRAVLLFHRGHEHSARLRHLAHALVDERTAVFAWDARGHGNSPGDRGYAPHFADFVADADHFARHAAAAHGVPPDRTAIVAHSVGAVIAAAWVHDYAPPVRAMVLAVPAFRVKLYVPLALPGLRLLNRFIPRTNVKSYVKAGMLTHDETEAAAYASDPLISRQIATNVLIDLHDTSTRLLADAGAIRTPTLVLSAARDYVVHNRAHKTFFDRLSSDLKEHVTYDGFFHSVYHEKDRHLPIAKTKQFLDRAFAAAPLPPTLDADARGYTRSEYDRLVKPLPALSPKALNFRGQRLFLNTLGRLSHGVALGWSTGFDSGQSLDHVYTHRPRGVTPLGRLIDHFYLNAIGWRGIRIRRQNLQQLLRRAIAESPNQPAHVLDIAAGAGRYVLDTLAALPPDSATARLRDDKEQNLAAARALAASLHLQQVTIERADAFDPTSYATLSPKPDVAIISGLFELFPDNLKILTALRALAAAMPPGAQLIYTNQPWHPQLEMIARVLTNREGHPWIMRRRTQEEMDALVASAGFEKQRTLIDPCGIFTASLAKRV